MASGSDVTLLSAIVERESTERGFRTVSFQLNGDPDAQAIVDATVADYHTRADREPVTTERLESLLGQKVTLLLAGQGAFGAGSITARPVTLRTASDGKRLAYLPKGKRTHGFILDPDRVLDVEPGYDGVAALKERVDAVRAAFPQVQGLTKERLAQLPTRSNTCSLAVFGTHQMPDGPAPASIWLIEDYLAEDDIVEGTLIIRPEYGESEHGSVFGRDLLRMGGEVVGFQPMPLREALDLCNTDHEAALARIRS